MSAGEPPPTARYEMVVGLEVHVQLDTRTKAFCACSAEYGAAPNTNVCPVCLGLPGTLPVLNHHAVELAARTAIALGCTVHEASVFARKNYFYPDLPKGYQITQHDRPLATGGCLAIGHTAEGAPLTVGIARLHMEEDAGKSVHDRYPGASAIDLNRAGVPLIEIVSEPEIRSAQAARAYLATLRQLLEYLGVSDVNMEEGSLRVDANVSARPRGTLALGTKTEIKNLNSFSAVERSLDAEFARQCAVLARGGAVAQQTMLWDAAAGTVRPARAKEGSEDYRYFPEPDLPPLLLGAEDVARIRRELPELPQARRERFAREYGLGAYDSDVLTATPALADYFEHAARAYGGGAEDFKSVANWIAGELLAAVRATGREVAHFTVRPADLAELLALVRDGTVSRTAAKQVWNTMVRTGEPPAQVVQREGLAQVSDEGRLRGWLEEVIAERPEEARRYAAGETKLRGVLVGAVMRRSGGRADPKRLDALLASRLGPGARR